MLAVAAEPSRSGCSVAAAPAAEVAPDPDEPKGEAALLEKGLLAVAPPLPPPLAAGAAALEPSLALSRMACAQARTVGGASKNSGGGEQESKPEDGREEECVASHPHEADCLPCTQRLHDLRDVAGASQLNHRATYMGCLIINAERPELGRVKQLADHVVVKRLILRHCPAKSSCDGSKQAK